MTTQSVITQQRNLLKSIQLQSGRSDGVVFFTGNGDAGIFRVSEYDVAQGDFGLEPVLKGRLVCAIDTSLTVFQGATLANGPIAFEPTGEILPEDHVVSKLSLMDYERAHPNVTSLSKTLVTLGSDQQAGRQYRERFSTSKSMVLSHMAEMFDDLPKELGSPFSYEHAKGMIGLNAHLRGELSKQSEPAIPSDDLIFSLAKKITDEHLPFNSFVDMVAHALALKVTDDSAVGLLMNKSDLLDSLKQIGDPQMPHSPLHENDIKAPEIETQRDLSYIHRKPF